MKYNFIYNGFFSVAYTTLQLLTNVVIYAHTYTCMDVLTYVCAFSEAFVSMHIQCIYIHISTYAHTYMNQIKKIQRHIHTYVHNYINTDGKSLIMTTNNTQYDHFMFKYIQNFFLMRCSVICDVFTCTFGC